MKNDRKTVRARQMDILNLIRRRGEARVEEIAAAFNISEMTVRRDLSLLDRDKLIRRVHGGAVALERDKNRDEDDIVLCRERISEYAAGIVEDGETLFINGSRTALGLCKYLQDKRVTVITNNGWALGEEYPADVKISLTGGELFDRIMTGEYVVKNLLNQSADRSFIGCAAVYDDGQFQYDIPTEIGINEAMIGRTEKHLYVLADHSKLKRREERMHSYGSCSYNSPCTLITDTKASPEIAERLRAYGIEVVLVPV